MVSLKDCKPFFPDFQTKAPVEAAGAASPANEGPNNNFDATEGDLHKRMVYSKDVEVAFGHSAPGVLLHKLVRFFAYSTVAKLTPRSTSIY